MARAAASLPSLALSRGGLDRHSELRTEPGLLDVLLDDPATRVLELVDGRAEVDELEGGGDEAPVDLRYRSPTPADREGFVAYLGHDAPTGGTAYLLSVPQGTDDERRRPPQAWPASGWRTPRDLDAGVLTTATGLANWHARHGFCPRCGAPTQPSNSGWTRVCPIDESEHYPRTDPAVIMSVIDDQDRILLARGVGFAPQGMSVLAGFVEPGESLAECRGARGARGGRRLRERRHLPR